MAPKSKIHFLKDYVLFLFFGAICTTITAQTPSLINYQAIARKNSTELLINETFKVRFEIFTEDQGNSSPVYSEEATVMTNDLGLFSYKIGSNDPGSVLKNLNWLTAKHFLRVELDFNQNNQFEPDENLGFTQLVSVPYSLASERATVAESVTNLNINNIDAPAPTNGQVLQWNGSAWVPANPAGLPGPTGPQGPQGPQGPAGATGPQGPAGIQGPAGAAGPAGPAGPAGASGDRYSTTSSSSLPISNGTKNLIVAPGLSYATGQTVIIANSATNLMTGTVVSYNANSGAMVVSVNSIIGSGTYSNWTVSLNGAPGPAGPQGPQGTTGNTGPQGPAGPQGPTGATGAQGPAGPQGVPGTTGAAGPQGPAGPPGSTGAAGTNGKTVLNGTSNPASGTGTTGDFYINTTTNQLFGPKTGSGWGTGVSLVGPAGATGPSGAAGPAGPQGPKGDKGDAGAAGAQGPKGDKGDAGATGPAGPQGATGPQGPAGAAGTNGTNGKTVLNGTTAPALALGTVGDFYINTATNQLFGPKTASSWGSGVSLVGPAGATGPQGPAGAQGPQGQTGSTGPQGPIGLTGPAGPTGATGPQGPAGISGANGKTVLNGSSNPTSGTGTVGDFYINTTNNLLFGPKTAGGWGSGVSLVGPAGAAGATGPAGPQGATGPQGPAGAAGATGPAGATGATGPQGPAGSANANGTTNYISKFTGSTSLGNSTVFDNGTSVGIGVTTLPAESKLIVGAVNNSNEGGQIQLNAPGGSYTTAYYIDNFENRFRVLSGTNTGSSATRLAIGSNGNVGVGTEGPASKLHVVAGASNALELEGGIKVSGAAANRAAFQITATVGNLVGFLDAGTYLRINSIYSNNNPSCLIYVTPIGKTENGAPANITPAVFYDNFYNAWFIQNRSNTSGTVLSGQSFNVLIIDF